MPVQIQDLYRAPLSYPVGQALCCYCLILNRRAEVTKSFRGANFSPFVRAYVPQLEAQGISKEEFVVFIDGLNEALIAHPIFTGLGVLGGVMTFFYGIHPVQWAGMGLQVASGVAGGAVSYTRTRAYVKAMNATLFHPAGLHLNVLATKKMMAKIGHPEEKLHLPPLEDDLDVEHHRRTRSSSGDAPSISASGDDPRMRRLDALKNFVLPLDLDVPTQALPDNLLKKMGASQARRSDHRQLKKLTEKREERQKEYSKKCHEAEKKGREGDKEIAKVEKKLASQEAKLQKDLASSSQKKRDKAMEKFQEEESKLREELRKEISKKEKEVAKEMKHADKQLTKIDKKENKVANKIRWIVITNWEGEEEEEEGVEDSDIGEQGPSRA